MVNCTRSAGVGSGARGLELFREDLVAFTRYRTLRPLATLSYCSDAINYSTIVSTIEFDKDEEFFAIAGVTKRIKVLHQCITQDITRLRIVVLMVHLICKNQVFVCMHLHVCR